MKNLKKFIWRQKLNRWAKRVLKDSGDTPGERHYWNKLFRALIKHK